MMATITSKAQRLLSNTAYHMVRRAQASIGSYLNFGTGDLTQYLERESFTLMATRLTDRYFNRSKDLQINKQVISIYISLLIMAPILQRLPLSFRFDWHRGHLLSFIRTNSSGSVGRFHVAQREVKRNYQPDLLAANLAAFGIHDGGVVAVLQDLYRRHSGGTTLQHRLAHQLFDPIMLVTEKQGYELRIGNHLLRMEKLPFEGSTDLRRAAYTLLDFSIRSVAHNGGYHLEIQIAESCIAEFRQHVDRIMDSSVAPDYKQTAVENRIRDFVERTRSARSAKPQILELKRWLANKVRKLAGASPEAKLLSELLVNLWLQRVDAHLYVKSPNFFFSPEQHDEKTYTVFFSPYREY
jgi:hypothetical protein